MNQSTKKKYDSFTFHSQDEAIYQYGLISWSGNRKLHEEIYQSMNELFADLSGLCEDYVSREGQK